MQLAYKMVMKQRNMTIKRHHLFVECTLRSIKKDIMYEYVCDVTFKGTII